jgi:hypothetical protein
MHAYTHVDRWKLIPDNQKRGHLNKNVMGSEHSVVWKIWKVNIPLYTCGRLTWDRVQVGDRPPLHPQKKKKNIPLYILNKLVGALDVISMNKYF